MLLVDAFQGVEAQTVANAYAAMEHDLTIVPVLNKIDLKHARPDEVIAEMESVLAIDPDEVLRCSGKTRRRRRGTAATRSSSAFRRRRAIPTAPLQAMVFDCHYDEFRGAITYVRVMNGTVRKGQKIRFLQSRHDARSARAGPVRPAAPRLRPAAGRPGGLPDLQHQVARPGPRRRHRDRRRRRRRPSRCPAIARRSGWSTAGCILPTARTSKSCATRSTSSAINDPSFEFEPETSDALGFGFRCGFLGLLHMEIVQQRLEGEADIDLVQTAPNVTYEILTTNGETLEIHKPQKVPDAGEIEEFRQPIVRVNFVLPTESIGPVMKLCTDRRGVYVRTEYLSPTRAMLTFDLPLADVIYDMHDKLKSVTRGYGTMDYELIGYFPADLVRLDILVGGKRVDALSHHLRPPRRRPPRPGRRQEAADRDRPAHVRDRAAGRDRHAHHRPRNDLGDAQERDRQVLRRRHHAASASCGRSRRKARSG